MSVRNDVRLRARGIEAGVTVEVNYGSCQAVASVKSHLRLVAVGVGDQHRVAVGVVGGIVTNEK